MLRAVAERLRSEGLYPRQVRLSRETGPDIEARLPTGRRLLLEAKGDRGGGRAQRQRAAVGEALLQVLSAFGTPEAVHALAFPYNDGYERLMRRIFPGLRRLGIHILLVDENGAVWHVGPDALGFFPEKPKSLVETLDVSR